MDTSMPRADDAHVEWAYDPETGLVSGADHWASDFGIEPDAPGGVTISRFCEAFGYPAGERLELAIRNAAENHADFDLVLETGAAAGPMRIRGHPTDEDTVPAVCGDISMIAAARQTAHDLWRAGGFDPETDLPNAYLFRDRLDMAVAYAERGSGGLAVVYLAVNGTRGGVGATAVVARVAEQLRAVLRSTDTSARIAPSVFGLVLPGAVEVNRIVPPLERVRAQADPGGSGAVLLRMSCGVAIYPTHGKTREELMASAELASVRAMRNGLVGSAPFAWSVAPSRAS